MGQLFDGRCRLDQLIHERKLDPIHIYGEVGLKAGMLVSLIKSSTPDDPAKLQKLRKAAEDVLHVPL